MKLYAGRTELTHAVTAAVLIAGLGVGAFMAGLLVGTNVVMAIGAAVITWMAIAVMVWLATPRFLGPTLVALPVILAVVLWIVIVLFTSAAG